MLDVGAIQLSQSPRACAMVLVRKKDGMLRFCNDLWKLNSKSAKDSYSIPRIRDTLDYPSGAVWLTSLELKSGYWQVEMDGAGKTLIALTVGPLVFYECERMPYGLGPATFQCVMEMCLAELQRNWWIMYLDYIVYLCHFNGTPQHLRAVFEHLNQAGRKF